ncbi:hypothetical protein ASE69_15850 [Sphingomonas sp. Leaf208]|nr:hypothetical protein ASE69_15850 [Sphingomonas sp. Leaf208]
MLRSGVESTLDLFWIEIIGSHNGHPFIAGIQVQLFYGPGRIRLNVNIVRFAWLSMQRLG